MSCKHPLKGFPVGLTKHGNIQYRIRSYNVDHLELRHDTNGHAYWKDVYSPSVEFSACSDIVRDFVEIPCGKCIDCRLKYSRQWADRCMFEKQNHDSSFFLTLTYDDAHLVYNHWQDKTTGEFGSTATLVKSDLQKFMKRLRRAYEDKCKCDGIEDSKLMYYACGEYGTQTARPHYHMIVYGLRLDDLKPYKRSPQGFWYYNSEWLSKLWPFGYVVVADVDWDCCAYVARYIMKKQTGKAAEVYEKYNFAQEFTTMSLKPAIGKAYYEQHKDTLYKTDYINLSMPSGGKRVYPSRYFDKLYELDNPEEMEYIKSRRKQFAEDFAALKQSSTSKSYLEMLATEESVIESQIKALKRKEI